VQDQRTFFPLAKRYHDAYLIIAFVRVPFRRHLYIYYGAGEWIRRRRMIQGEDVHEGFDARVLRWEVCRDDGVYVIAYFRESVVYGSC
jgi:hypothetical protein